MASDADVVIRPVADDVDEVVRFVAALQADPAHHVASVGLDQDLVRAELCAVAGMTERMLVAITDDRVVGAIVADVDHQLGRAFWYGPWAGTTDQEAALFDHARGLLLAGATEEELAPDARNTTVRALGRARGFTEDTGSAVLVLDDPDDGAHDPSWTEALHPVHHAVVARVHDELFPGVHTPGSRLVDGDDDVRVIVEDGSVIGYVATRAEPDGSMYVDFVGVEPAHRRRGVGRALIADAVAVAGSGGAPRVHLTVRVDNTAARALYASLGFAEERVIQPMRRGFTLH